MRKFTALAAVAAIMTVGGTAVAKEKKADSPGEVKEKKICKSQISTGSRLAQKKVCRTQAEWNAMGGQDALDDAVGKLQGISRGN
jgi:hypothetical protein